jgi:hypothetical protein
MMAHRYTPGHMITRAVVAFLLVGSMSGRLVAAETGAGSKGAEMNACALMSDDEIAAVAHFKVEHGVRKDSGQIGDGAYKGSYSSTCLWKAAEDQDASNPNLPLGGARFAILNVMSWPAGSHAAAKFLQDFRDAARDQIIDNMPVALKIGDDALWWGDGVAVRKGDISFGVSVHSVNERSNERQMETVLAKKIVSRF